MFVTKHKLCAPADGDGAAAAASLLASAADTPPPPPAGSEGAPPPDAPTLDEATGRWSDVPEKFWDPEKKALRLDERGLPIGLLKGHRELEKRFGEVPGKAEDYKLELADGETLEHDEEATKAFAAQAHEWGLTQKQFNAAVRAHLAAVEGLKANAAEATAEAAREALLKHYGSEAAMTKELRDAFRAFKQFADPEEMAAIDQLGNNPIAVRLLAKVAKALKEDAPPDDTSPNVEATEIEKLMKDPKSAYWNSRAPGHDDAVARVRKWHERQAGKTA